jgi:acyl carrier protein
MADRALGKETGEIEISQSLQRIWQSVLRAPVEPADNFFDLDGDSFEAVRIITRIRSELGCEVSLLDLFDRPTIEELAPIVAESLKRARDASAISA